MTSCADDAYPTLRLRPPPLEAETQDLEAETQDEARPTLQMQWDRPRRAAPRIGEWLVRRGVLDARQLRRSLEVARAHGWRVGDAAVLLRFAPRCLIEAEASILELRDGAYNRRRRRLELLVAQIHREYRESRQVQQCVNASA